MIFGIKVKSIFGYWYKYTRKIGFVVQGHIFYSPSNLFGLVVKQKWTNND